MNMVISPWVYLLLHFLQTYPLAEAFGSWYGPSARYLSHTIHVAVAISEHFPLQFPQLDNVVYGFNLFMLGPLEYFLFLYLSYHNAAGAKKDEEDGNAVAKDEPPSEENGNNSQWARMREKIIVVSRDRKAINENRAIITTWIVLLALFAFTTMAIGLGPPDLLTPQQQVEQFLDQFYSIGHFVGHSFHAICFAHISSVVDFSIPPKKGWVVELMIKRIGAFWKKIWERTLISSITMCFIAAAVAFAIENWDKVSITNDKGGVPFFPPFCQARVEAKHECSLLGITIPCYQSFNDDAMEYFGFGLEMSHVWTFISTFAIGVFYLWATQLKSFEDAKSKSLKVVCALYAMETSFFALFRMFWGVSKPLVLIAAGHNLFEWFIVLHVWKYGAKPGKTVHDELFTRCSWAALFIATIISICMCIPDLFYCLAAEQLFGIVLDFALPMMFLAQLYDEDEKRRTKKIKIYWMAAAAHIVHIFGTILPLSLGIFLSGHVSWFSNFYLEVLINVCVPVTHYLYCAWSFELDKLNNEYDWSFGDEHAASEAATKLSMAWRRRTTIRRPGRRNRQTVFKMGGGKVTVGPKYSRKSGLLPWNYRITNVPSYLAAGFVLGLLALAIGPAVLLKECEDPGCAVQNYVARTSILKVDKGGFRDLHSSQNIIRKLQKERPGLIDIIVGHARHEVAPGGFHFVEKWSTAEDISDDLIDSFANTSLGQAREEGKWQELGIAKVFTTTCASKRSSNISFKMDHSCKSVWKVVGSPDYCTWVPFCKFMRQTELAQHAQLYMADGTILDAAIVKNEKEMSIQVSALSLTRTLTGYSGVLSLEKIGRSYCQVIYYFRNTNEGLSSRASESYFHEFSIPDLHAKVIN